MFHCRRPVVICCAQFIFLALDMIWQIIVQTYSPWIQTIQTEKSQLIPWIQADIESGTKMMESVAVVFEKVFTCFAGKKLQAK